MQFPGNENYAVNAMKVLFVSHCSAKQSDQIVNKSLTGSSLFNKNKQYLWSEKHDELHHRILLVVSALDCWFPQCELDMLTLHMVIYFPLCHYIITLIVYHDNFMVIVEYISGAVVLFL